MHTDRQPNFESMALPQPLAWMLLPPPKLSENYVSSSFMCMQLCTCKCCQIWHVGLRPSARLCAHAERRCLHLKGVVHGAQVTIQPYSLPVWQVQSDRVCAGAVGDSRVLHFPDGRPNKQPPRSGCRRGARRRRCDHSLYLSKTGLGDMHHTRHRGHFSAQAQCVHSNVNHGRQSAVATSHAHTYCGGHGQSSQRMQGQHRAPGWFRSPRNGSRQGHGCLQACWA